MANVYSEEDQACVVMLHQANQMRLEASKVEAELLKQKQQASVPGYKVLMTIGTYLVQLAVYTVASGVVVGTLGGLLLLALHLRNVVGL